jgi:hypothetical protein
VESLIKASIHTSDFVNQNVANQNLTQHIEVDRLTAYLLLHYSQNSRTENPSYLHVGPRRPGIFLLQEFLLPS